MKTCFLKPIFKSSIRLSSLEQLVFTIGKTFRSITITFLLILLLSNCASKGITLTRSQLVMGHVPLNISLKIRSSQKLEALQITDDVYQLEKKLERQLSEYQSSSDAFCLNENAGKNFCNISPATFQILERALKLNKQSEGAFDIRFNSKSALGKSGKIILEKHRAKLAHPETRIALSSLLKGYILDELILFLKAKGFDQISLDAGGDIAASGGPWKVAIQIPGEAYGKNSEVFEISNQALCTASNSENPNNIVNPENNLTPNPQSSVSVISNTALEANSLATTLYVMGKEKSHDFLKNYPNAKVIWLGK